MIYEELLPLLRWKCRTLPKPVTPSDLSEALSLAHYQEVPDRLLPLLVGFRHRTQGGRQAVCERFIWKKPVRKTPMKRIPRLDWKYDESGQHTHSVQVGARIFSAFISLPTGRVHFTDDGRDPRWSKIVFDNFDQANARAVEILRKDMAELKKLGI